VANLTITVDAETLRRARIRALDELWTEDLGAGRTCAAYESSTRSLRTLRARTQPFRLPP